jgi:uncharacterized membrane protein YqjE
MLSLFVQRSVIAAVAVLFVTRAASYHWQQVSQRRAWLLASTRHSMNDYWRA